LAFQKNRLAVKKLNAASIAAIGSGLFVVLIALALGFFSSRSTEKMLNEHVQLHLQRDALILDQAMGSITALDQLDADLSLQQHFLAVDSSFSILDKQGMLRAGVKPPAAIAGHSKTTVHFEQGALQMIAYAEQADFRNKKYTLLIWRDMSHETKDLVVARWISFGSALFAGFLGALGVGWVVAKQFQPIDALNSQIARNKDAFSLRELDIPARGVEATRLANSYNDVVVDLRNQFRDVERFAEHCAHELRTPLATLRLSIEGDLAKLESSDLNKDGNRPSQLQSQLETLDRLSVLINRLLSLARSRNDHEREAANLRTIVLAAVDEISPLLEEGGWRVNNQIDPEHRVYCQPAALHQAMIDLLDNCLKHNDPYGLIILSSKQVDRMLLLTVENVNIAKARANIAVADLAANGARLGPENESYGLGQPIVRRLMREMGGSVAWIAQPNGMMVLLHLQKA
jgi:signal transduction histidine kinase